MGTEKAQPGAQLICFFVGAGPGGGQVHDEERLCGGNCPSMSPASLGGCHGRRPTGGQGSDRGASFIEQLLSPDVLCSSHLSPPVFLTGVLSRVFPQGRVPGSLITKPGIKMTFQRYHEAAFFSPLLSQIISST